MGRSCGVFFRLDIIVHFNYVMEKSLIVADAHELLNYILSSRGLTDGQKKCIFVSPYHD